MENVGRVMDIPSFIFGMLLGAAVCLVFLRTWVLNALDESRSFYKRAIAVNEEIRAALNKSEGV